MIKRAKTSLEFNLTTNSEADILPEKTNGALNNIRFQKELHALSAHLECKTLVGLGFLSRNQNNFEREESQVR